MKVRYVDWLLYYCILFLPIMPFAFGDIIFSKSYFADKIFITKILFLPLIFSGEQF